MEINVSNLPNEILIQILKNLDGRTKLIASQVCKRWLKALNYRDLLHDITFVVQNEESAKSLFSLTRQFIRLRFHSITIHDYILQFLKENRNQFFGLSFIDCYVDKTRFEHNLEDRIPRCNNLQYLISKKCDAYALFTSLPKLNFLHLHHSCSLTDLDFHELHKTMPHLKTLKLQVHIACDPRAYRRFYNKGRTLENRPSDMILSFPAVRNFIAKRSTTLKYLCVNNTNLTPEGMIEISKLPGLKLEEAVFNCYFLPELLDEFCLNQPHLRVVNLTHLLRITDESLASVCHTLKNLHNLEIMHKNGFNHSVKEIFKLDRLRVLRLDYCQGISPTSFKEAISQTRITNLEDLDLGYTYLNDETLRALLAQNKDLVNLNISGTEVSDETLNMIFKNHTKLKYLGLSFCECISNSALTGEIKRKRRRIELLNDNGGASEDTMDVELDVVNDNVSPTVPLANLKDLQTLDLSFNFQLSPDALLKAIHFPHLKKLYIMRHNECMFSSSYDQTLRDQNPSLKELIYTNNLKEIKT